MELTEAQRTIGDGPMGPNGDLRTGGLENPMEEAERTASRWKHLEWVCGMMSTAPASKEDAGEDWAILPVI